jgi:CheY-like chemotaxis protein
MADEHEAEAAPRRALVVDDDAAIRILVTRILTRHGFQVDAANDGAEAIEALLQHDYALITLDLMMPRIDGYGVMKYLADHKPELAPRVIVMTAFGSGAVEKVCPPAVRFIHKPFDIERLLAEADDAAVS